ncbi:MAG TPA: DUF2523 family protein [Gammaproteobacteria bacterium]|nr:DUF2523 family protein [Gammaproteobacteria bacterium]
MGLGDIISASLLGVVVRLAVKVMLAFGVVLVSQQFAIGPMFAYITSLIPGDAGPWIALSRIPDALSIIAAAYTIRIAKRVFFGTAQASS